MADGPPLKGCFVRGGRGGWGWCEGSEVSGDRFASGDSPIHLSLTPTPGARGEQSACGQGKYDPNPLLLSSTSSSPPPTTTITTTTTTTTILSLSTGPGHRGNSMLGRLPRLAVVVRVLVSLGQS